MSPRLTFFFPTSAISVGVVWGLTRYSTNVTMVNNDQREIKWLPVLRAGVQRPQKTRSATVLSIISCMDDIFFSIRFNLSTNDMLFSSSG